MDSRGAEIQALCGSARVPAAYLLTEEVKLHANDMCVRDMAHAPRSVSADSVRAFWLR